ncbi:MAG TPA: ABC transporter substrate-binding protein [Mycobacteriales bacterium]|jgi:ABC-type branched-subunit amino acid transport system substrate-binding protein|nr:ABC transporter substrate-binding protein [Mycobacteriales bacterium]
MSERRGIAATLRRGRWLVGCGAVVLAVTACGGSSSPSSSSTSSSSTPLHILLVTNVTGAGSQNGTSNVAGVKEAINEVNQAGGVLGRQLVLDVKDDGSDNTKDLPLIQSATASYKYPLVMNSDPAAASTAPYIARQSLLEICGCAAEKYAEPSAPNPTIFDTDYVGARPMDAAAQYAQSKGYTRVAVMVQQGEFGDADLQALKPLISSTGGTITDSESLSFTGVDFTSAIARSRASHPQALLTDIFGAGDAHLRTEIHDSGWNIPIISGSNDAATALKGLVPLADLKGQVVVGPRSMAYPSEPAAQTFIDNLQKAGVNVTSYLYGYGGDHDGVTLFAWAANQTHSLDATTIANKLHSSGDVAVPGLVEGTTTGYSATSGEWNAASGLALMEAGYYNLGRLKLIKSVSAPTLPAGM